ncbi:hypothetical protein L4174_008490 [Photobacterium sp. CCB-ST2H9]|uniref:hypothetical protein n=1 Tax=Photobacterium sp. CCB-ST2H9 TaxID=2912855 RepID=UPI0020066925|nr:hypothetical protein [Photobacterium sp. CCB-ST2H9]UTM55905.1 hypothetical protein L4174_008490 [Photobacterium sp. CCB-ST2H9]
MIVILCLLFLPWSSLSVALTIAGEDLLDDCMNPAIEMTQPDCCDGMTDQMSEGKQRTCHESLHAVNCEQHCQSSCHTSLFMPASPLFPLMLTSAISFHAYASGYWDEPVSTRLRPPIRS